MNYKIRWLIVLLVAAVVLLGISFKTAFQINKFFTLDSKIRANVEKVDIIEGKKDKFDVIAFYNFKIGDKNFYNVKKFTTKFINEITALDFKEKILKKDFFIWYNKKNPKISAAEKSFPIKNLVYSIITFIVFGYFVVLKYYVFSFQKIS
ncbi:MAG: hypothetical protein KR126chlam4_00324 [Candidatus Anoxychlamydiales bacterium]|nr:hypothetical protein [Candidatus Anoxychlamydiales bacterium]NGX40502.1 hypothetical protein [Candidatus Anoxychlamydiales bacterium]HEU64310.1 hypothetical protein [Chlamydiota bacterium]